MSKIKKECTAGCKYYIDELQHKNRKLEKDKKEMLAIIWSTWHSLCNDDSDFDLLAEFIEKESFAGIKIIEEVLE